MAVQKKKRSISISRRRRNGRKVILMAYHKCSNCGEDNYQHFICKSCGFYRGKQLLKIKQTNKKTTKE